MNCDLEVAEGTELTTKERSERRRRRKLFETEDKYGEMRTK